jgi:membrane protease YdiL (CAAX protease family)
MMPKGRRWQYFSEPLAHVESQSRRYVAGGTSVDWKVIAVLVTTAVSLTVQEYCFPAQNLARMIHALGQTGAGGMLDGLGTLSGSPRDQALTGLIFWAVGTWITYVILPALVIKLVLRGRVRDYGLRVRGIIGGSWVYLLFFGALVPWLLFFSRTDSFQARYPFYRPQPGEPLWPRFYVWELFYATQFLCLEFFFRGFVLHGTRHRFGAYSIFVMMVPYCMIHYGKPLPETFGAIGAGIVLGFMSLKTRSIWLGALLHVAVALSMDLLALGSTGQFA